MRERVVEQLSGDSWKNKEKKKKTGKRWVVRAEATEQTGSRKEQIAPPKLRG